MLEQLSRDDLPPALPDVADGFMASDDALGQLTQALVSSSALFSGRSLQAMIFLHRYAPQTYALIDSHASRRGNKKTLMEALKSVSLYEKFQNINLGLGSK